MPGEPAFKDRREAGRRLAAALHDFALMHPLVLALPRGGVPVAFEVSEGLQAELDVLFVRKIGSPGYEELGIGAVVDGAEPQLVLNEDLVRQLAPSPEYIRHEMQRQLDIIEKRRALYTGERTPFPVIGRVVIIVDDGIATGGTIRAALMGLSKVHPARIIVAVPVAPPDTIASLRMICDEIVCLDQPYDFRAVGAHYQDFTQTTDDEVVELLTLAHHHAQQRR